MEWPAETIRHLRQMWDEGLPTAEIGRRLGQSKNSVIGKAHRIGLPGRPSPIKYKSEPRPRKPRVPRMRALSLPPLACLNGSAPPPASCKVYVQPARIKQPEVPMARPTAAKSVFVGPPKPCCWPIGEPGTPDFHFCGEPSKPGKPYCPTHCRQGYIVVRDRREDHGAA